MRSPDDLALIAAIADDLAAGVWVATVPEGRFVYSNRAFDRIMGMGPVPDVAAGEYAAPYGIYGRDGELYPESKMPFVRALQAQATVVVDDIVIHRRDGQHVYVRALANPMLDAAGTMTHIAIAFFDITREVEAESARARAEAERAAGLLRELEARHRTAEAEDRLRVVVGNAPVILFALDLHGVITLAEGRGLQRLGDAAATLVGTHLFTAFASSPEIVDNCRRALAGETVSYFTTGASGSFEVKVGPMHDAGGAVIGAIGVATDVTERRRAEGQLAQAERMATVGMLAAGVAHEINNPMAYVLGNVDLAARSLERLSSAGASEELVALQAMIADAREGVERVRSIVRDLKMFSRVDERAPGRVDVRACLDAALQIVRNEIRHRARLVQELEPVLPVHADAGKLGQLFLNLLVNASQAIPEGAAADNEIRVATRPADGGVSIEVADTGVGIASGDLRRIFDPFFTTKPLGLGTGLGLSICHAIATELGGRIEVESAPRRGSLFRVWLPAAASNELADPTLPPPFDAPSPRRGAVLVIDDEPLILRIVTGLLAQEHDVVCESRAHLALQRIRAGERFDAILCDLMMPDLTGMDLYRALLAFAPEQADAVVFMTGGAFTPRARAFLDSVPNPVVEKPFDAAVLLARVRARVG